ncbi:Pantoate-beta-alanine ligase [Polystyrenella longa]|uniref:Pantothenate synthetase n=1 Tax=Polystyrenella longa TaxID=2528007 RepID=A0A518CJY4_9PLAN|nr:pantoate--beta-alanine ligase [Polystyrenella longa]QDU79543.1 Pantoate-beta-alanine ligase [Polystyrenella longa]
MPRLLTTIPEVRDAISTCRKQNGDEAKIGFVPTMGALHRGHAALIEAAAAECETVIVSIFVNPTQFAPHEDLDKYPRTLEADLELCDEYGAAIVFHPSAKEMYPPEFRSVVDVEGVTGLLEGEHRPTHFQGVTTVVMKLFNIVQADRAYFGQKDYQQQMVIRKMVEDLNLPVEIVTVPTWRDPDGLALSSRNKFLSSTEREQALVLSRVLKSTADRIRTGETDFQMLVTQAIVEITETGLKPDYFSIANTKTLEKLQAPLAEMVLLVAAYAGSTRLIDNSTVSLSH